MTARFITIHQSYSDEHSKPFVIRKSVSLHLHNFLNFALFNSIFSLTVDFIDGMFMCFI